MNSATWLVQGSDDRWVAKAVLRATAPWFAAGMDLAARLADAGVPTGAPVPTTAGNLVAEVNGLWLALLTWVPGEPLTGADRSEQEVIGRTLARVHRILREQHVDNPQRFHWVDPAAAHLTIRPWIRPAVAAALEAYDRLDPESLTWGLLHADPAPEAFRRDPASGECGLIDWGGALLGPLLYDLASAAMYVGGPHRAGPLLAAYREQRVVPDHEIDHALPVLLRLRWAVQADYFARRIATGDLTGIAGHAENEAGLDHARRHLATVEHHPVAEGSTGCADRAP